MSCDFFLKVMRPKIHHSNHFSHGPPTSNGVKLTELREQLGEERNVNCIAQIAPIASVQGWFINKC